LPNSSRCLGLGCAPLLIATGSNDDLAEVFSEENSTANISAADARRAALLMANSFELAMCLEALVDVAHSDKDFLQQCHGQVEQAQRVLAKAYGASA
jgi:hypothetical protein